MKERRCRERRRLAEVAVKTAVPLLLKFLAAVAVLSWMYIESRYLGFTPLLNLLEYVLRLPA